MNRPKILVTPRSLTTEPLERLDLLAPLRDAGYELLSGPAGQAPTEDQLLELVPGCVGWLAGVERISEPVLAAAPLLRVISRNGAGADAIDREAAGARGIRVLTAPGANARGVAELAVLMTLAALRSMPQANNALKSGQWTRTMGREIVDCTVGVVGLGAIGRLVGSLMTSLGAAVLAYDPFAPEMPENSLIERVSLSQLFSRADVVTLHCPPSSDGKPVISRDLVSLLKPGSILVNTARSSLVDADAILNALNDKVLAAYAVDAFDTEPPELTELLMHENTIMTPHIGGFTTSSSRRAVQQSVDGLIAALAEVNTAGTQPH